MSQPKRTRPALLTGVPLSEALGRKNGFGLLRLALAVSVIFSHSMPLGMGKEDLGLLQTRGQANVGSIAVAGFFVLSGLLITRSGMRLSVGRFLWNRAIRILPGFWACMLLTAFVVAPLVAYHQGRLGTFWSHPQGPWAYVQANWGLGVDQWGISGLLDHNPYSGVFNGSIWSLAYEVFCYLVVAALAATGILKRARWAVGLAVAGLYVFIVSLATSYPHLRAPEYGPTLIAGWRLPILGGLSPDELMPLLLMFGLGALAELYRDKFRINGLVAVLALVAFLGTARYGGFTVLGLPALAYLLIWVAARMPGPLTKVGSKVDLSYGVYIYAFVIQQCLSLFHMNRWGYFPYVGLSIGLSLLAALCSWYVVEKPSMRLKNIGMAQHSTHRRAGSTPAPTPEPVAGLVPVEGQLTPVPESH